MYIEPNSFTIKKQDGGSDAIMERYHQETPSTQTPLATISNDTFYVNHKGLTLYDLEDETTRRLIVSTTTLTLKDLTPKTGKSLPRSVHEVILSSKILKSQIEFHGTFISGEIVLFVERSSKCFTEVVTTPPGPHMSAKQFYDSLK